MAALTANAGEGAKMKGEEFDTREDDEESKKYVQSFREHRYDFTDDEKVGFANIFFKRIDENNYMTNCRGCEKLYQPDSMPYQLKCGHSYCHQCYQSVSGNLCSDCGHDEQVPYPPPNRDLLICSLSFANAVQIVMQSRERPGRKMTLPMGNMRLTGFDRIFEEASYGIYAINTCREYIHFKQSKVDEAFKILNDMAIELLKIRSEENREINETQMMLKRIKDLMNYTHVFQSKIQKVDGLLFYCLRDSAINKQDFYQLQTNEIRFTKQGISSVASSQFDCWGMAFLKQRYVYCKLIFGGGNIIALSFEEFPPYSQDLYIIDHALLSHECFAAGVYFLLEFGDEQEYPVYLTIKDNSLFSRQLSLLASGESGPSFKSGKGYVDEERIVFQSYVENEKDCSNDCVYGILDVVGESMVPDVGSVCVERLFDREAEFYINKVQSKDVRQCIGYMKWGVPTKFPVGEFTISKCGVIFNLIIPKEPTEPPKE